MLYYIFFAKSNKTSRLRTLAWCRLFKKKNVTGLFKKKTFTMDIRSYFRKGNGTPKHQKTDHEPLNQQSTSTNTSGEIVQPMPMQQHEVDNLGEPERESRPEPSEQSETGAKELIKGFDEPNHEKACNIPTQREKGRTLNFQQHWYTKFPWLHYCPQLQAVICFSCATADSQDLLKTERCEQAFISAGYKNWKKALEKFNSHQSSTSHKQAVFKLSQRDKGVNVAAQLNTQYQRQQGQNRICLLKVVSSVKYLLRQGLAYRGHTETEGNLYQLLLMQARYDPDMQQWLRRSTSFLSHECIEEIQTIFSHNILQAIISDIKETQYYAVIIDGTQDIKMKEQESICIRRVDKDLHVHEEFVGFYEPNETTGAALASTIKDALLRLGLSPDNLRGQTYDGAAIWLANTTDVRQF